MKTLWQKYATVLVDYCTNVKENDLVIISAEAQAKPLILAVYEEVLKRGANPIIRTRLDGQAETFFKVASDNQLQFVDRLQKWNMIP